MSTSWPMGLQRPELNFRIVARLIVFVILAGPSFSSAAPRSIDSPQVARRDQSERVPVDRVWAGTRVGFDSVVADGQAYVAYYDADRWLTVAKVDLRTKNVDKRRLNSRYGGWDGHNYVTLTYDPFGILHVSGNMHTVPLVYARTMKSRDFDSLVLVNQMVGSDEDSVTYPSFFALPNGLLGFSYRAGRSGDGHEFINAFDGQRWIRWVDNPLFSTGTPSERVSAYRTGYIRAPDGTFHVAWVWRKSSEASANFNVCYAKSSDLRTWFDSQGRSLQLPITPNTAEVVDRIEPGEGLFNNLKLGFNLKGKPVISYLKFDERGNTQLYHANSNGSDWDILQATQWDYRWDFRGKGTLVSEISFSGVKVQSGQLRETVRHVKYGSQTYVYDLVTLEPFEVSRAPPLAVLQQVEKNGSDPFVTENKIASIADNSVQGRYSVTWKALPANNNDKVRSCESVGLPQGCEFASELYLEIHK